MAAPIGTALPTTFTAGDTLKFQITLDEYSAADWTLYYVLVKSDTQITFNSSASGTAFLVNVAKATTANWSAGEYRFTAYVADATERKTVDSGAIEILTDISQESSGYDDRSHVKIVLDALESVIEGKASSDTMMTKVGDRSLSRMSASEIYDWYKTYQQLYEDELRAEELANGKTNHKNSVYMRFK